MSNILGIIPLRYVMTKVYNLQGKAGQLYARYASQKDKISTCDFSGSENLVLTFCMPLACTGT